MNQSAFVDAVRDSNETALSRLGSSKSLYALTGGQMEEDVVLARAADLSYYAAETFDEWADEQGAFATAAETARGHYETVAGELDDHEPGDASAVYDELADLEGAAARLGGLAGWTVVVGETTGQLTGYFTGQADPQTSQVFRSIRGDVEDVRDEALDALAEADDWDAAREAADAVVQAAYDEYFETLEDLGVNPKPVC
jgi:hypothetical protein